LLIIVHCAAGALRITTQDGKHPIALAIICLQSIGNFSSNLYAATPAGIHIQQLADGLARLPGSTEAHSGYLWTRHLQNADVVLPTKANYIPIHGRKRCGSSIVGILVQYALNHGH
jgi:hypothetical protein